MKEIRLKENGITLVALVVTIIILLILSGIAISNLLGENGLINQAKLGKEKYAISEAKEKIELEITNLQIEQQSKGEALTKEILPKINNEDIDVGDTSNFPVEVICGKYKFEVDNVFQVKYIGEADDTVIKYTTEPDDYTNQSNVKVLLKISNPKGIKSIKKPGEKESEIVQNQTKIETDFCVSKNGHYIIEVIDAEDKEVKKDIYIDLIDTLLPEEFTPEVQKNENSITVIEKGKDADATEESSKSGIDHYEYYIIDSSNKETKYDTNKIDNLEFGAYKLYLIAFDKAGNSKKSNNIDFKISVPFKEMAVGGYHILALDNDNNLWAWGDNEFGQLGDGTTTNKTSPTKIETNITFVQLSAGAFHNAGIDTEGRLWVWGLNTFGQLGDGTTINKSKPQKIMGDKEFTKVMASGYLTLAIDTNNEIWHLGKDFGNSSFANKEIRKLNFKIEYSEISGNSHYLFLDNRKKLWSFGSNSYGELGDGTTNTKTSPVQIKSEVQFLQVSAGDEFCLAIDSDGNLWSWGKNDECQLGDGTTTNKAIPEQIKTEKKFTQISAGKNHCLAIDNEGNLWSWGRNNRGQLGDGTRTDKTSPIKIMDGIKFKKIYARYYSSLALDINGNLWSWGRNADGQLGDGTTIDRYTPVQIN